MSNSALCIGDENTELLQELRRNPNADEFERERLMTLVIKDFLDDHADDDADELVAERDGIYESGFEEGRAEGFAAGFEDAKAQFSPKAPA